MQNETMQDSIVNENNKKCSRCGSDKLNFVLQKPTKKRGFMASIIWFIFFVFLFGWLLSLIGMFIKDKKQGLVTYAICQNCGFSEDMSLKEKQAIEDVELTFDDKLGCFQLILSSFFILPPVLFLFNGDFHLLSFMVMCSICAGCIFVIIKLTNLLKRFKK